MATYVTLSGRVVRTTHAAILFKPDPDEDVEAIHNEIWIPRSVCMDGDVADDGDTDIAVKKWWLEKNGHQHLLVR